MPRKADPKLEKNILIAATRLLDRRGLDAVTMREVAKAAGTTTPTLYERFKDRDALLVGILDRVADEMLVRVEPINSVEGMAEECLRYCLEIPNRIDLMHRVWPHTIPTDRQRPVFDLAVKRLQSQHGHSYKKADEIASAILAVLLGTAILMIGAGTKTDFAIKTRKIGLKSVQLLCKGM